MRASHLSNNYRKLICKSTTPSVDFQLCKSGLFSSHPDGESHFPTTLPRGGLRRPDPERKPNSTIHSYNAYYYNISPKFHTCLPRPPSKWKIRPVSLFLSAEQSCIRAEEKEFISSTSIIINILLLLLLFLSAATFKCGTQHIVSQSVSPPPWLPVYVCMHAWEVEWRMKKKEANCWRSFQKRSKRNSIGIGTGSGERGRWRVEKSKERERK